MLLVNQVELLVDKERVFFLTEWLQGKVLTFHKAYVILTNK